jgi:hypothetical protein
MGEFCSAILNISKSKGSQNHQGNPRRQIVEVELSESKTESEEEPTPIPTPIKKERKNRRKATKKRHLRRRQDRRNYSMTATNTNRAWSGTTTGVGQQTGHTKRHGVNSVRRIQRKERRITCGAFGNCWLERKLGRSDTHQGFGTGSASK